MKKFICLLFFFSIILCSCGEQNLQTEPTKSQSEQSYTEIVKNKIQDFEENLKKSESYIYNNNTEVLVGNKLPVEWFFQDIEMKVNNSDNIFDMKLNRKNKDGFFENEFCYAEKNHNIYNIYTLFAYQTSYDCMSYHSTVEDFYKQLEEFYKLNINGRKQVIDSKECLYLNGKYQFKYDFFDFCELFEDQILDLCLEKLKDIALDSFVLVEYEFNDNSMVITHNFDLDGKDNEIIKGQNICFETKYTIKEHDLKKFNKDTIRLTLRDIDSEEIVDATNFKQIILSENYKNGYLKIYLEAGKYYLTLNVVYDMNPNDIEYEVYDESKQKIEKSDQYELKSGYYYIYINPKNTLPIIINKVS